MQVQSPQMGPKLYGQSFPYPMGVHTRNAAKRSSFEHTGAAVSRVLAIHYTCPCRCPPTLGPMSGEETPQSVWLFSFTAL